MVLFDIRDCSSLGDLENHLRWFSTGALSCPSARFRHGLGAIGFPSSLFFRRLSRFVSLGYSTSLRFLGEVVRSVSSLLMPSKNSFRLSSRRGFLLNCELGFRDGIFFLDGERGRRAPSVGNRLMGAISSGRDDRCSFLAFMPFLRFTCVCGCG